MTTRSYTNTLLLEGALDSISPSASFARLADQVMQPSVEIVEEDCGTLLGERVLLAYDYTGRIPAGSSTPLTAATIEAAVNAGEPYMRLRSTSTCVSDGGVCRLCYRSTSPELGTGTGTFDPVTPPLAYSTASQILAGQIVDDLHVVSGANVPALSTVQVFVNGTLTATVTADSTGAWITSPLGVFASGNYSVAYKVVYNGAVGAISPSINFIIRAIDEYDHLVTLYVTGEGIPSAGVASAATDAEIVQNLSPYSRSGSVVATPQLKYSPSGTSKFGTTSFEFFGGQDSRLSFPVKAFLDNLGNADWTIEFQIMPKSAGSTMLIAQQANSTSTYPWQFLLNADSTITILILGQVGVAGSWSLTSTQTCPVGSWTYVKAYRLDDKLYLQMGNTLAGPQTITTTVTGLSSPLSFKSNDSVILGGYSTTLVASLDAHLGYFRITRGVGRVGAQPTTPFASARPSRVQVEKIRETFSGGAGVALDGTSLDVPGVPWQNFSGSLDKAIFLNGTGGASSVSGHTDAAYSVVALLGSPIPAGVGWQAKFSIKTPPSSPVSAAFPTSLAISFDSAQEAFWAISFKGGMASTQYVGTSGQTAPYIQDYPVGGGVATVRLWGTGTGKIFSAVSWGSYDSDPINGETEMVCLALQAAYIPGPFDRINLTMFDPGLEIYDIQVTTQAWTNPITPPLPSSTPGSADVVVNVGDVLPAESAYVLDTQVVKLTSPTSAVGLKNPQNSFYKLRVYVDGKLKPASAYTISGSDLSLSVPATSQVVIKYVSNTRTPFFYDLAAKYFGSLMGVRPLSVVRLPLKKTLYEQLTPKEDVDELVEKLRNTDAPPEAVEYLAACKSPLEKSIGALLLASLFMQ